MTIAAGIDVGTGAVKAAIFSVENGKETWLSRAILRIRQRDPIELISKRLSEQGVIDEEGFKEIDKEIRALVNEAAEFAANDPEPDASELTTDVVASA